MTTELMERPETATDEFAMVQRGQTGAMALALLSEQDFEQRIVMLKLARARVERVQRELMTEDEDYGVIPGTKKPTLLKPGAEKLCQAYRLVPTFIEQLIEGDGEARPHLRVLSRCSLHLGSKDGPIVGEGVGAANSWERKYRYRSAQRACPSCGCEGTIRRSKFEDRETGDKGWYCHDKAGGCGAQFRSTDPKITEQQGGQVDNPDPYDVENTLLKMATKRAQIDAVLRATATSGLFAQDLEDLPGGEDVGQAAPVKPAERVSNGNGHTTAPKQTTSAAPASGSPSTGKVVKVEEREANGKKFWSVTLNTGFICVTYSEKLSAAAKDAHQRGFVVECNCRAPKDPKYKPMLDELNYVQAQA